MVGHAFAIQNQFGRLLDETFYKAELARRCSESGLAMAREVLICVGHGPFCKDYFLDLVLGGSTVTEGKCVEVLTRAHRGQALNYLLLAGTHHGSLVNFRPTRVQREFVSTQLDLDLRRAFTVSQDRWPADAEHKRLLDAATAFCADVGLGLDLPLYRQAFMTLANGRPQTPLPVPVWSAGRVVHEHPMYRVTEEVGVAAKRNHQGKSVR